MGNEKLSFEFKVIKVMRTLTDKFKQQGLEVDSSYLDYFGYECPRCRIKMKLYRNTVKGVGSISSFIISDQNKAVVYPLCKSCVKKLNGGYYNPMEDKKVEEYIGSKLPELKRKNALSDKEKKDEIKKEYEIIKKLTE